MPEITVRDPRPQFVRDNQTFMATIHTAPEAQLSERRATNLRSMREIRLAANGRALTSEEASRIGLAADENDQIDHELQFVRQSRGRLSETFVADDTPAEHRGGDLLAANGEFRTLAPKESYAAALRQRAKVANIELPELDADKYWALALGLEPRNAQAEKRVMLQGIDTSGGYSVPMQEWGQIVDLARNKAAVLRAGATTFPMDSTDLGIVKVDSDPTGEWLPEGAEATASDMSLALHRMSAKKFSVYLETSLEVFEDGVGLGDAIRNAVAEVVANGVDLAALRGDGVGQPLGIRFTSGISNTLLSPAALPTHSDIATLASTIVTNNGPEVTSIIYNGAIWGVLDRTRDGEGKYYAGPPSFTSARRFVSNQIGSTYVAATGAAGGTTTEIYRGAFENLIVGVRSGFRFEISREADDSFKKYKVAMRGYWRGDIGNIRPNHFAILTGVNVA